MSTSEDSVGPPPSDSIPSSFDGTEFFEEGRSQKLWRKIKQEPLIPLGCAATCYALYQAARSIRAGNHNQTNKMFRARIYAQGFTLVALVAGSFYYKDERMQRKKFEGALEEKKATEKRDKWLRELEMRDEEERAWRTKVEDTYRKADEARQAAELAGKEVKAAAQKAGKEVKEAVEQRFTSKSVREQVTRDGWGPGTWILRAHDAWKRI